MNLRCFFRRKTFRNISKLNDRAFYQHSYGYRCVAAVSTSKPPISHPLGAYRGSSFMNFHKQYKIDNPFSRWIQTSAQDNLDGSSSNLECDSKYDASMNEFLSRFVWIMRKKLTAAYPDCDKDTINGMLVIIVESVVSEMEKGSLQQMTGPGATMSSQDFSEDLWRTVWEVSTVVLQDMEKEKRKERMKTFLQSEEVKQMYRFACEVGVRGDMLREFRFKWARQKMEKSDFYESMERMRKERAQNNSLENDQQGNGIVAGKVLEGDDNVDEGEQKSVSLPKRHGKIKYKIYGLDLSNPKWARVAGKIHESSKTMWPEEPKPISTKCKVVTEKILSLKDEDDPAPLLREWKDLLQPSRIDWVALLGKLEDKNLHLHFKVAEFLLCEDSFQANEWDYSKLIAAFSKEIRIEDAERVLKKMIDNGIQPDLVTTKILIKMYCKAGNLNKAKEVFDSCKARGIQPDVEVYSSMIMAYVNAKQPQNGEALRAEMEVRALKLPKEIYAALLQSFAKAGDAKRAEQLYNIMKFTMGSGLELDLESLGIMVEAYARVGDPDDARHYFDQIVNGGHRPDDECTASMISAYEKKNCLSEALELLLSLEKNGIEPGVATNTVLADWFIKYDLIEEAQQILDKISEQGEVPPFKLHVSICDMHIKSGAEKKALQALGVLESRIDELESEDFERIIFSLHKGGFVQDAVRIQGLMESRGFHLSKSVEVNLMASQSLGKNKKTLMRAK